MNLKMNALQVYFCGQMWSKTVTQLLELGLTYTIDLYSIKFTKLAVCFLQPTDHLSQFQPQLELVTDDLISCLLSGTFSGSTYTASPLFSNSLKHTHTHTHTHTNTHADSLSLWWQSTSKSDLKENTHVS